MFEIATGFLLGIVASVIVWYVLEHLIVPRVEFLPVIYKSKTHENPSGYKYRIKFRNIGLREILDFELFAKLRLRGVSSTTNWRAVYIPIDDPRIPLIPSHRGSAKRLAVQLLVSEIPDHAAAILPSGLRSARDNGSLTLEDLMALGNEGTLEIVGFGYDAFSGARKVFQSKVYGVGQVEDES